MIDKNLELLFYDKYQNGMLDILDNHQEFSLTMSDVTLVLDNRKKILRERQLIDFSTKSVVAWNDFLATQDVTKIEWAVKMSQFFEIFYELRELNSADVVDDILIEKIIEMAQYYDLDMEKAAGYFETNGVLKVEEDPFDGLDGFY